MELEKKAQEHDLMACVELAIAYMEGVECPSDCGKALDYASRLLFENQEFGLLLNRMDELLPADKEWLMRGLNEEALHIESMNQ